MEVTKVDFRPATDVDLEDIIKLTNLCFEEDTRICTSSLG